MAVFSMKGRKREDEKGYELSGEDSYNSKATANKITLKK